MHFFKVPVSIYFTKNNAYKICKIFLFVFHLKKIHITQYLFYYISQPWYFHVTFESIQFVGLLKKLFLVWQQSLVISLSPPEILLPCPGKWIWVNWYYIYFFTRGYIYFYINRSNEFYLDNHLPHLLVFCSEAIINAENKIAFKKSSNQNKSMYSNFDIFNRVF